MMQSKSLFVQDKIVNITQATRKKPASVTIELAHHKYLSHANRDVEGLIEGLFQQLVSSYSIKMPIRGLTLTWDEYTEDFGDG